MANDLIRLMRVLFTPAPPAADVQWKPAVDVYRTPDGWLVKCDLAGVRAEDVELTADGNKLTVRGVRRDCKREQGCRHYRMEIAYGRFERTLELPCDLGRAGISAETRDGMLMIHVNA